MPMTPPRTDAPRAQSAGLWTGIWGYRQAALALAGLAATGMLMQCIRGGASLHPPAWPVNGFLLLAFVGWIVLLSRQHSPLVSWLAGVPFALVSMLAVGFFGAIGGIVPQAAEAPGWARALGWNDVFRSPPFALLLLALLTNLGVATLRRIRALGWRGWLFLLNHAGIWITLTCAVFGAGDFVRARMVLTEGAAEARIVDASGRSGFLPVGILLHRFAIERDPGPDGRPGPVRSYAAHITVLHPDGNSEPASILVNQPLRLRGWSFYLADYELTPDGRLHRCVLETVRDPWLPGVYAGIFLLLAGAAGMLLQSPFPDPGERKESP